MRRLLFRLFHQHLIDKLLRLGHAQSLGNDTAEHLTAKGFIIDPQECSRMTFREMRRHDPFLLLKAEAQQTELVGDGTLLFSELDRRLLLR